MKRPRVLLAGLFHETHTFLDGLTTREDFTCRRGEELLLAAGDGSPLAAMVETGNASNWEWLPCLDLRATPGPLVHQSVLDEFCVALSEIWRKESPGGIDAVLLVLHGAMVTEHCADVEASVLRHVRGLPGGTDVPICGVLDLHGNISQNFYENADGFVAYRCNPHTDAYEAAARSARLLQSILHRKQRPRCVWSRPNIVWPPTGVGTADEPMRGLTELARRAEQQHPEIACINVFAGFAFADTPDTGVSFSAVTFGSEAVARSVLSELVNHAEANRKLGVRRDDPLAETWPRVEADIAAGRTPVLLVEPADNIGGGGPGDATTLLRELVQRQLGPSAVVIHDPVSVRELSEVQPQERCRLTVGGRGSRLTDGPVELTDCVLISRSNGRFELEDPQSHLASMAGLQIDMGPCAVLQAGVVTILLTSKRTPPFDLGQLRSQGMIPEEQAIIAVKAAVAHRQAYDPIAANSYTVATPGPCASDLSQLPFQNIRRPIYPLDEC